ncbi:MAG: hypothetical protein ABSE06_09920 [Anaerolineaceae bacterium]
MGEELEPVVECYSGSAYAERPIALLWDGQRLEFTGVEERWRIPGELCFRVRTRDNRRFELFFNELKATWKINEV